MVLRNSGRVGSRRFFREFIPSGQKTRGDDLFIDVGKEGGRITTELMHALINKIRLKIRIFTDNLYVMRIIIRIFVARIMSTYLRFR